MIPLVIFGKKHQMVVAVLSLSDLAVKTGTRCHIHFTADDRFDPGFQGSTIKVHHAIHNTVVRNGDAVHP